MYEIGVLRNLCESGSNEHIPKGQNSTIVLHIIINKNDSTGINDNIVFFLSSFKLIIDDSLITNHPIIKIVNIISSTTNNLVLLFFLTIAGSSYLS